MGISATTAMLISDAQSLILQARNQADALPPGDPRAAAMYEAIAQLESRISEPSPSQSEIASAMSALTQAMAGIY